jgi:hypothetical protein
VIQLAHPLSVSETLDAATKLIRLLAAGASGRLALTPTGRIATARAVLSRAGWLRTYGTLTWRVRLELEAAEHEARRWLEVS